MTAAIDIRIHCNLVKPPVAIPAAKVKQEIATGRDNYETNNAPRVAYRQVVRRTWNEAIYYYPPPLAMTVVCLSS